MAPLQWLIVTYQPYPNINSIAYYTPMLNRDKQGTFHKKLIINKMQAVILLLTNSYPKKEINKKMNLD